MAFYPWFDVRGRLVAATIVFGHWAPWLCGSPQTCWHWTAAACTANSSRQASGRLGKVFQVGCEGRLVAEGDQPVQSPVGRGTRTGHFRYPIFPGHAPHPRRHPKGPFIYSPILFCARSSQNNWKTSEDYLYGIDLYNWTYWWEAHEVFEGFWHTYGAYTGGNFFQTLIQCRVISNGNWGEQATETLFHALGSPTKVPFTIWA